MWRNCRFPVCVFLASQVVGCSTLSEDIEAKLDKVCVIPNGETADGRIVRARIALAAIAGYSYRTVDIFSTKEEASIDATQALNHIDFTLARIDDAQSRIKSDQYFFPVYRSDYRVELVRSAEVAAEPAVRAAKALGTGSALGLIGQSRPLLASLLEDQLYLDAYEETCKSVTTSDQLVELANEANRRIARRCTDLKVLAGASAPTAACAQAGTSSPASGASAPS